MSNENVPRPEKVEKRLIEIDEVKMDPKLTFSYADQREGVFVHSFICNNCGLHFNVFSWMENRHTVETVHCPECGKRGAFRHWKRVLSENPEFGISEQEIYRHVPFPGSQYMSDSRA
jgi:DNA-directed RNA polymerase subunit RPC12/RpoP